MIQTSEVAKQFGLSEAPQLVNTPEIRPTDIAMVITTNGVSQLAAWGFEVSWNKQPMINARSETLAEKVTFRNLLENRCIIPASCYFEWRNDGSAKRKNKIFVDGQNTFSMAGLIDGNRFTVITCKPVPAISHIHSRMPVILSSETEQAWLDPDLTFSDVSKYLYPSETLLLKAEEERPPEPAQKDLFG